MTHILLTINLTINSYKEINHAKQQLNLDLANCHPDGQTENSLPVTGQTHLHLVDEVSEDCSTAGRDETEGCQSQLSEDPELPNGGPGLTLEILSKSLKMPVAFLKAQGFEDGKHDGIPAIRIPYLDENGKTMAVKYQLGLQGRKGCFSQRKGDKPALYGLWKLDEIQDTGEVFLVDGVQDFLACWHHDISALALPENKVWRTDWNKYLVWIDCFPLGKRRSGSGRENLRSGRRTLDIYAS